MKSKIKKAIAILLGVCFLVSLTAAAVGAVYTAGGKLDNQEDKAVNLKHKEEKSLYERLGGIYAIAKVVNRFSDNVVNDPIAGKNSKNPALRDWTNNKLKIDYQASNS